MNSSTNDYKLIHKYYGLLGQLLVFVSEDHFLFVQRMALTEEYFRFPRNEIQSLKQCNNNSFVWIIVTGMVLSAVLLALGILLDDANLRFLWLGLGTIAAIVTMFVWWNGPGIRMTLQTLVSSHKFYAGPRRKVRKLQYELNQYIRETQGDFDAAQLVDELRNATREYHC